MSKLKIEFFHDIICSFCFPMSYSMRKLVDEVDNIEVIHRSFALVEKDEQFDLFYGSRENAKKEIVSHWEHANELDELHRFNIDGMNKANFPFPSSMVPLTASKAASIVGGEGKYWDMFDLLQEGLFVKNINIQDKDIVFNLAKSIDGLNFDKWKEVFENGEAEKAVLEDLKLVDAYGITSAPSLIINQKYSLGGAAPYDSLKNAVLKVMKEEGIEG